jgi:DNA-binding Lrp family transcriptional regulator
VRRNTTQADGAPEPQHLDAIDRQLLDLLQRDGRITNRDLAKAVHLSPSACLQRVRSLLDREVLIGYHARVGLRAINRGQEALISVRFRPHSRAIIDAFEQYILSMPETVSLAHTAGEDDVLVAVAVRDIAALREFILDKVTVRSEVVAVNTTIIFNHIRKPVVDPLD